MKITDNGIAIIESDTHICKWIKESGRLDHDQNMLPLVGKYISPGDVIIDIGAYVGDHTIYYSKKVGSRGKVLAFEPNPEAFECLKHNMKAYENTECYNLAIGEKVGKIAIDNSCVNKGMAHIKEGNDIDVITLDLVSVSKLNLIKIDCEGFEIEVLKGAKKTIEYFKPVLLIEINDATLNRYGKDRKEIFDILNSYGYTYSNIYKGQGLSDSQLDIICTIR
jgi:FkbM family methyltransferase